MMTFDEIEIGMLLKLEKIHQFEPNYIVKVVDKSVKDINGCKAKFIVIEDPEHPNKLISKQPYLFKPFFEETDKSFFQNGNAGRIRGKVRKA